MAKATDSLVPRETILIQFGGELPSQVHQGLRDKKYTTRTVNDLQSLSKTVASLSEPILIFHGGEVENSMSSCMEYLRGIAKNTQLPVILIGLEAGSFERELEQLFPCATTLNTPFGTAEVLAAVNYISRSYSDKRSRGLIKKSSASIEKSESIAAPKSAEKAPLELQREKTFGDGIFGNLEALDLLNRDLGGGLFSSGSIDETYLERHKLNPSDPKLKEIINEILFDVGKWGRLHLCRVAFMAQKVLEAMKPDLTLQEQVRGAAFLYAWSFAGVESELLKSNYLDARSTTRRQNLSKKIKQSADQIEETLGLANLRSVVNGLGDLIGSAERPIDSDFGITASALFAADLTSRFCFGNGSWNPRRGYVLLYKIKRGDFKEIHDLVLCCSIKFLAEALSARTPIFMLKRELRNNKEFLSALAREAHLPVKKDERRIPVSSLAPGMRLTQPLQALDGREILSTDLTLDADLIWRIWQLSAIRPLKSAVVRIKQEKGKAS